MPINYGDNMNTNVKGNEFPELDGMSSYIGTRISSAKPMNRSDYNDFRGWDLPADEDGSDEGFIAQYSDGYVSWSPAAQFKEACRKTDGMNFGLAVEAMKKGFKVQRKGWNGKGMFCLYVPGTKSVDLKAGSPYYEALKSAYDEDCAQQPQEILPHIDMWTINAEGRRAMLPGWLASQTDMLADDWRLLN